MRSRVENEGRIVQASYTAPLLYELRLIAGGRYLTPKHPITYDQLEALDKEQPFVAGELRIERSRLGYDVSLLDEPWTHVSAYQWTQLWDPVLEEDPTEFTYEQIMGE